ncbi:hypothetical protein K2173_005403 [Erythroxylum novogranatense]|uniref:Uncharacterized protein n=1 Tax=Erythroxylum novogranatense TaxID=1862640 RepID=A0AAV8TDL7_9ROSI|nr:hypothetical protein K2173_005403 [Erythroxylum novogranatense]
MTSWKRGHGMLAEWNELTRSVESEKTFEEVVEELENLANICLVELQQKDIMEQPNEQSQELQKTELVNRTDKCAGVDVIVVVSNTTPIEVVKDSRSSEDEYTSDVAVDVLNGDVVSL